jgi:hypothetical protein
MVVLMVSDWVSLTMTYELVLLLVGAAAMERRGGSAPIET